MSERYDVFISYRHNGGRDHARNVKLALKNMHPFLDFDEQEELEKGKFDQRIMEAIEEAPTFLIILSEGALDGCEDEDDWVRKEILYAHQLGKHIIPVEVDRCYHEKTDTIPESVREIVGAHQFAPLDTEVLFQDSINRLIVRIGKNDDSKEDDVLHEGAEVHFEVDYPCWISRFGKELLLAKPEETDNLAYLKKGKHKLEFKAVDFPNVKEVRMVEIPDPDMSVIVDVDLKVKVDEEREQIEKERIKKEREARGEFAVRGVDFKMIYVEGGTFTMGATLKQGGEAGSDEKPVHKVTVSDYYIGETVVTQALWKAVMGVDNNPSQSNGHDNCPVEMVSWNDVTQNFIPELNRMTGRKFRLPTESEWEYAARGGNKSRGYKYSGSDYVDEVAWYKKDRVFVDTGWDWVGTKIRAYGDTMRKGAEGDWAQGMFPNFESRTRPVKHKRENELGLYDMSGNVWEWCKDEYKDYSGDSQVNPGRDSVEFDDSRSRVCRGGSSNSDASGCRVACRVSIDPSTRNDHLGFRLVLDVNLPQEEEKKA